MTMLIIFFFNMSNCVFMHITKSMSVNFYKPSTSTEDCENRLLTKSSYKTICIVRVIPLKFPLKKLFKKTVTV